MPKGASVNRHERRKAERIKRKVRALPPAQRELAIQTGMELHDALAEKRAKEHEERIQRKVAELYDEALRKAREEEGKARDDERKKHEAIVREHLTAMDEVIKARDAWRRAYLYTYLDWFAGGGSPPSRIPMSADKVVQLALVDFHDRLEVIESRVGKEVSHFEHPELLYGALRWLATTYHDAKTRTVSCPDLEKSCRLASGFRYAWSQSEVTMGQYNSDYEIKLRGKVAKLREHLAYGTGRGPRRTIRIAFVWDGESKHVVVGYIGQHQQTRAS
jgi:hypothetical protein